MAFLCLSCSHYVLSSCTFCFSYQRSDHKKDEAYSAESFMGCFFSGTTKVIRFWITSRRFRRWRISWRNFKKRFEDVPRSGYIQKKIKDFFFCPWYWSGSFISKASADTIKIEISRSSSYFGSLGGIIVSHLTSPHELTVKIIKHLAVWKCKL